MKLNMRSNIEDWDDFVQSVNCEHEKTRVITICFVGFSNVKKSRYIMETCEDCKNDARERGNNLGYLVHSEMLKKNSI